MYLPTIYPGELFYSWVGRVILHSLYTSFGGRTKLFGKDLAVSLRFPRIGVLKNTLLFSDFEIDRMITDHALINFYLEFLHKGREKEILEKIKASITSNWSFENEIGLNRKKNNFSNVPRYCPVCNHDNTLQFGEIYWRREHQVDGIDVCFLHNCFLENCQDPEEDQRKIKLYLPIEENCPKKKPRLNNSNILFDIAKLCSEMISNTQTIDLNYESRAKMLGYSSGKRIDQVSVESDFNTFYSNSIPSVKYSQLLFIKNKVINPFRHLMLHYFFNTMASSGRGKVTSSFKERFWDKHYLEKMSLKCINPDCQIMFNVNCKSVTLNYDPKAKRTILKVSCLCGTSFTKSFIIENDVVVKSFVRVCRNSINTVKTKSKPSDLELRKMRSEWLNLKSTSRKSSSEKRMLYTLTKRLKNYNQGVWLDQQNLLLNKNRKAENKRIEVKEMKDSIKRVAVSANQLYKQLPDFRITKTKILQAANITDKLKDHLSITKEIARYVEEVQDFQIRRIKAVAKKMKSEGKRITLSSLLFKAHIWKRSKLVISEAKKVTD